LRDSVLLTNDDSAAELSPGARGGDVSTYTWPKALKGLAKLSFTVRKGRKIQMGEEKMDEQVKEAKPASRRKFLGGAAGAAAGGGALLAAPNIVRAQGTVLKMQGSWGDQSIFSEMARQYAERVEKMSGGSLKIDYLPAGAVVQAFQVQDACHDGVLDAAHTVTAYWYGKNKAASLFGTGPVFGANAAQILAWIHNGGGKELYQELVQDVLDLNLVGFFAMPMPTQPLGWFKDKIASAADMDGLKYRTVGLATDIMQGMGLSVTSRRRNRACPGARRDRGVRVQQPDGGSPVRRPGRLEALSHGLLPSGGRVLRDHLQPRHL